MMKMVGRRPRSRNLCNGGVSTWLVLQRLNWRRQCVHIGKVCDRIKHTGKEEASKGEDECQDLRGIYENAPSDLTGSAPDDERDCSAFSRSG